MCPVCIATAALLVGKATSAGGGAAIVIKKFTGKKAIDTNSAPKPSKLSENRSAAGEIIPNSNQRRGQYANVRCSEREDRLAGGVA
jgi:hypothetical protein